MNELMQKKKTQRNNGTPIEGEDTLLPQI